jgi:hypothetical protein
MEVRITPLRVAMAAQFVLAGVGLGSLVSPLVGSALANVGQVVNISDHSGSAFFAKVSSDGKLAVGDDAGPLSVDGTVSGRPAAPASPWRASTNINTNTLATIAGPSSSPINLTSLSVSTNKPSGSGLLVVLYGEHVSSSATSCTAAIYDTTVWLIHDAGDGVTPVSFTFPTPLQWKPPANTKACLMATAATTTTTTMNAVGFYGG